MCARRAHRPVNQGPLTADPMGKQRGVLVFGRHDDAAALEVAEIFSERQRDAWTVARKCRVDDGVFLYFFNVSDARILDTP